MTEIMGATQARTPGSVTETIKILRRSRLDAPVDQCEVFGLREMEKKLFQVGARHLRWRD